MFRWEFLKRKKQAPKGGEVQTSTADDWKFLREQPDFDAAEMSHVHALDVQGVEGSEQAASLRRRTDSEIQPLKTPTRRIHSTSPEADAAELADVEVEITPTLSLEVLTRGRNAVQFVAGNGLIGRSDPLASHSEASAPEIDLWEDDAVSRRHARVEVRNGRYWLFDLNSTNGTLHNGRRLMPGLEVPLEPGDEIEVGSCSLLRVLNTSRDALLSEEDLMLGKMLNDAMVVPLRRRSVEHPPLEYDPEAYGSSGDDLLELVLEKGEAEGLLAVTPTGKQPRSGSLEPRQWRLHDPLGGDFPF